MQNELIHLEQVLEPERPFLAVVAGAKYDTKIGPLSQIYKTVDHLLLGGVIYNTFLCAKYDVRMAGVDEVDINAARELLRQDRQNRKILELPFVVESDILEDRSEGRFRTLNTTDFKPGNAYGYLLDVAPKSFEETGVAEVIKSARTILVNAVMGFTPKFFEGSETLYRTIGQNAHALKLIGGGDTLQEFKNLNPDLYQAAMNDSRYYFFTGGGTVLKAIEQGTPYHLEPVKALMENAERRAG
jgi:phosphoglycerate kinase